MHNSTVLVGVTMAAAALAAPIDATHTSDLFSNSVTNPAPSNAKVTYHSALGYYPALLAPIVINWKSFQGETLPVFATSPSSPLPKGTGVSEFEQEVFSRLGEALRQKLDTEDLNPYHSQGNTE